MPLMTSQILCPFVNSIKLSFVAMALLSGSLLNISIVVVHLDTYRSDQIVQNNVLYCKMLVLMLMMVNPVMMVYNKLYNNHNAPHSS